MAPDDFVQRHESDVVPIAGVAWAGIAEPNQELHGLLAGGGSLALALAFLLGLFFAFAFLAFLLAFRCFGFFFLFDG